MAIALSSLRKISNQLQPLILIYATAGMGKTSTALEAENAVYIQIAPERPPVGIEPYGFGEMSSYGQVVEALAAIYTEDHNIKNVVIDSADALEPLIWQETCKRNNWPNLEAPGFGKGYMAADAVWREFLAGCDALRRDKGIGVTLLALADANNHEEPGQPPYKRYDLKLHKRAEGLLTQSADAVLFINTKVVVKEVETGFNKTDRHAEGGGTRWLFTDGRPAFVAKNRFNMPDSMALPKGQAWAAIQKFLPELAAPVADVAPVSAEQPVAAPVENQAAVDLAA
jgi:AAA domain